MIYFNIVLIYQRQDDPEDQDGSLCGEVPFIVRYTAERQRRKDCETPIKNSFPSKIQQTNVTKGKCITYKKIAHFICLQYESCTSVAVFCTNKNCFSHFTERHRQRTKYLPTWRSNLRHCPVRMLVRMRIVCGCWFPLCVQHWKSDAEDKCMFAHVKKEKEKWEEDKQPAAGIFVALLCEFSRHGMTIKAFTFTKDTQNSSTRKVWRDRNNKKPKKLRVNTHITWSVARESSGALHSSPTQGNLETPFSRNLQVNELKEEDVPPTQTIPRPSCSLFCPFELRTRSNLQQRYNARCFDVLMRIMINPNESREAENGAAHPK